MSHQCMNKLKHAGSRNITIISCQHVDHASRGAHDDLAATLQLRDLLWDARPSVHADNIEAEGLGELLGVLCDLHGQLSGGCEDHP